MSDETQSGVENHPETRLLQVLTLSDGRIVRILELNGRYFSHVRTRSINDTGSIMPLDSPEQRSLLKKGPLSAPIAENWFALPRAPLGARLETAMNQFHTNNPSSFTPPAPPLQAYLSAAFSMAAQDTGTRRTEEAPLVPTVSPETTPPSMATPAVEDPTPLPSLPPESPPSVPESPVYLALAQAHHHQQQQLQQAQQLKLRIEEEQQQMEHLLLTHHTLAQEVAGLEQRLERFERSSHHYTQDETQLLKQTAHNLEALQAELTRLLVEGCALEALFQLHPAHAQSLAAGSAAARLQHTLQGVVQQRRLVHHLLQQHTQAQLERDRREALLARKQIVEHELNQLQQAINTLENANRELLHLDPLALPEPLPVAALYEVARLEFELQVIRQDPGFHHPLFTLAEETP